MTHLAHCPWRSHVWGGLLLAIAACTAPPATVHSDVTPDNIATLSALREADVVYLGERHDSAADHAAQLEILKALQESDSEIAIAMEMFQRPFQPVLDRYLAGEISEAELVEQSEYEQRWGFPWELYAPILRLAQANDWPVLALNAPTEVVRQVAGQGLDSLTADDFRYIPPRDQIDTGNADYQALVMGAFGAHGAHGEMNFENFFAAQVLWDETMAETIAEFHLANPGYQVVVLAGQGHVVYGYGIPDRVERRLGAEVNQQIVLLNPPAAITEARDGVANLFWYHGE